MTECNRLSFGYSKTNLALVLRQQTGDLEGEAETEWETGFIIDGAASGAPKRRHDVTFPLLT
jgi:hypothetical protein